MRILASRPLATASLASVVVCVASFFLSDLYEMILGAALLLLFLALCVVWLCRRRWADMRRSAWLLTAILCAALMLLSWMRSVWYFEFGAQEAALAAKENAPIRTQCVILDENAAGSGYSYYTVQVTKIGEQQADLRAVLICSYTAVFHMGDMIEAEAVPQLPQTYYDREEMSFAVADGIRLCLISDDESAAQVVGHRERELMWCFVRLQNNLSVRLADMLGKERGNLAAAFFLGDREYLDDRISTYFRRAGVSHLLALSGLHVALLIGIFTSVAYHIGVSKKGRAVLLAVFALCYLALTGFSVSAMRAVFMVLAAYLSELLGRRSDPLTTLLVIAQVLLLLSPSTIADGGFWMSFGSVFGLVTILPKCGEWLEAKRISGWIRQMTLGLLASCIAVTAGSFFSWLFGGEIAPVGIVLTVLLTPILSAVLALTPIALLLDVLPMFSSLPTAYLLRTLLGVMIDLTDKVAHLPRVSYSLHGLPYGVLLGLMTAVLLVMLICPLKRKLFLLLPPILTVAILIGGRSLWNRRLYEHTLQASYAVRSSGSVLVVTDYDQTVWIDTSSGSDAMMRDAENAAREHGATEIRAVVLTHYHRSHIYSIERLAKRRILRFVYLPMPQTESEYAILSALHDRMALLSTQLICYSDGEQLALLNDLQFMRTDASYLERSNQPVVTYMLQTSSEILTFSSIPVQETPYYATFRWIAEQTDIMILGKHGPIAKTVPDFPTDGLRLLLTDHSDLLACLDLTPGSGIYGLNHVTDISCFDFQISR